MQNILITFLWTFLLCMPCLLLLVQPGFSDMGSAQKGIAVPVTQEVKTQ